MVSVSVERDWPNRLSCAFVGLKQRARRFLRLMYMEDPKWFHPDHEQMNLPITATLLIVSCQQRADVYARTVTDIGRELGEEEGRQKEEELALKALQLLFDITSKINAEEMTVLGTIRRHAAHHGCLPLVNKYAEEDRSAM